MPLADLDGTSIAFDVMGDGPPVLLLHGFPQTRALWTGIARDLAQSHTVVTADLRGYGDSDKPEPGQNHTNYSFRAMATDQNRLMQHLGFRSFHLAGHDRGARVAYRLALDSPDAVQSLTLMDIVPTDFLVENWTYPVSKAYFHWSLLAQPAPFPEIMIEADPDRFFEACLLGWGGASLGEFESLGVYRAAWSDQATIAGMCHDYRAGVTVDLEQDEADRGRKLAMPTLVLFGVSGVMAKTFDVEQVWRDRAEYLEAKPISGGHFFVDQSPRETLAALLAFLDSQSSASTSR